MKKVLMVASATLVTMGGSAISADNASINLTGEVAISCTVDATETPTASDVNVTSTASQDVANIDLSCNSAGTLDVYANSTNGSKLINQTSGNAEEVGYTATLGGIFGPISLVQNGSAITDEGDVAYATANNTVSETLSINTDGSGVVAGSYTDTIHIAIDVQ